MPRRRDTVDRTTVAAYLRQLADETEGTGPEYHWLVDAAEAVADGNVRRGDIDPKWLIWVRKRVRRQGK